MLENRRNKLSPLHIQKQEKPRRRSEEASHQRAFFQWLSLWNRDIRALTFHIPNGGKRDAKEAVHLKLQGVTAGVPDIFVAIPSIGYSGLFIEMKSKSGKLSNLQCDMIHNLMNRGYKVCVCHSWFEAKDTLIDYLRITDARQHAV